MRPLRCLESEPKSGAILVIYSHSPYSLYRLGHRGCFGQSLHHRWVIGYIPQGASQLRKGVLPLVHGCRLSFGAPVELPLESGRLEGSVCVLNGLGQPCHQGADQGHHDRERQEHSRPDAEWRQQHCLWSPGVIGRIFIHVM